METLISWLPIVVATALAFWAYRLGKDMKQTAQKPFEVIEFAGKRYWGVDLEEKHLGARVIELLKQIKGHQEGVETYKGTFFPMRFKSSLNPS